MIIFVPTKLFSACSSFATERLSRSVCVCVYGGGGGERGRG